MTFAPVEWPSFRAQLDELDRALDLAELSKQLAPIPLDVWAAIILDPMLHLPRTGHLLPRMPAAEIQDEWTGAHGPALMRLSLGFVRSLLELAGHALRSGPVLDYGVGWGRLSRLLLKYVPVKDLHGVDAWEASLEQARACGLPHKLSLVSTRLEEGELGDSFSLIYSFSVFTHLAPEAFTHNLGRLAEALRPGGQLVLTVRPPEFWNSPRMNPDRDERGPLGQDIEHIGNTRQDYGDTVATPAWIAVQMRSCGLVDLQTDWNYADPYQVLWSGRRPE